MDSFCRKLPKVELHAHLNGSLSRSTILELKRYYADSGFEDLSSDKFQTGAGDFKNLTECFNEFTLAHSLTSTPEALMIATALTIQEFYNDGCCYIELRSTPRDTNHMTKRQYIETIIEAMQNASHKMCIFCRLIISINRSSLLSEAEEICDLAIEYYKKCPEVVVGIELSGLPTTGRFKDLISIFAKARDTGLKVSLHCGEVCNPEEILDMLQFKPDRIGHGTCIHPKYGGTEETWLALCEYKIPVEICLTSNVSTKSTPNYESHHFKYMYDAGIPTILSTDDKGIFQTSLSQEYRICAETFEFDQKKLALLALDSCHYVFAEDLKNVIRDIILRFINKDT